MMTGDDERYAEVTALPIDGPAAHLGAAAFLAVVAYPSRSEWPKRMAFVEAWKACLSKHYIRCHPDNKMVIKPEYRKRPNQQINNTINNGIDRILKRRFPAALIATDILLFKEPTAARLIGTALLMGVQKTFRQTGAHEDQVQKIKLSRIERPKGTATAAAGRAAVKLKAKTQDVKDVANNIMSRVWAESCPVMHLALALHSIRLQRESFDPFHLVNNPDWLPGAINSAELLRQLLGQAHDFSRFKFVVLRPAPSSCP